MKPLSNFAALSAALLLAPFAHSQILLQDFSAVVNPNTVFYGTWEASNQTLGSEFPNEYFVQGDGVYDITGATATNANTSRIEFYFDPGVSLGQNTFLQVTAQALSLNQATSFQVVLVDTSQKTAFATFDAVSFLTGSYSMQAVALTMQGGFNAAAIDSMIITGGIPGGSDRFNFSFDSIYATDGSAIPEPSTYAAIFGALALGFVAYRRRMAKAV
jgi:hypothetical protein